MVERPAGGPDRVSRRAFSVGAAVAGALAGFPIVASARSEIRWRWQGAWTAKDIFHEYALDYAKRVRDMSGGDLRIEVLPAGAVVKPEELLDAVHKGALDGCHAVSDLWRARNTAFSLFGAGPALGMDANNLLAWMEYGGGKALYRELYDRALYPQVIGFLYGPMPTQPLGWFRRPLASADPLKGLRYGATGLAGELFAELGAKPEALSAEEIVPALNKERLDAAAFNNATSDRQLGMPEAARYCMLQSYHRPAEVFEILINRQKFDALPARLKAVLAHAAEAASAGMSWKAIHRYSEDLAQMRERRNVEFRTTPASVLREQLRAWQALAARKSRDNPFFARVLESQLAWARRTVGWALDTIVDPRIAYDHWFAKKPPARG